MSTIQEGWKQMVKNVGLEKAPPMQMIEMRRAFFAGAAQVFVMMTNEAADMEDDDACKFLSGIQNELAQFGEDVGNGKA